VTEGRTPRRQPAGTDKHVRGSICQSLGSGSRFARPTLANPLLLRAARNDEFGHRGCPTLSVLSPHVGWHATVGRVPTMALLLTAHTARASRCVEVFCSDSTRDAHCNMTVYGQWVAVKGPVASHRALHSLGVIRHHLDLDPHVVLAQPLNPQARPQRLVVRAPLAHVARHGLVRLVVQRDVVRPDRVHLRARATAARSALRSSFRRELPGANTG
jgi:hypothetical protein